MQSIMTAQAPAGSGYQCYFSPQVYRYHGSAPFLESGKIGPQSTLVGLREQGQYVSQAGGQLLILVRDDRLYRLATVVRSLPTSPSLVVILAQHPDVSHPSP